MRLNAREIVGVCLLLIVLSLQLFFSVRRESQTWDEANHIFAGYRSWTHGDYGLNPEHPPLVKLLNEPIDVPESINGPVLISASNLSGVEFGPGPLDPYGEFKLLKPTAVIDHGVFVFDGKFDLPLAAAISKVQKAQNLAQAKQLDQALKEAQAAVVLAPDSIRTQLALGDILLEMGLPQQARA